MDAMFFKAFAGVICIIIALALQTTCTQLFINESIIIENKEFNTTCTSPNTSTYSTWHVGSNQLFYVASNATTGECVTQGGEELAVRCYHPNENLYIVTVSPKRDQHGENWTCDINFIISNTITLNISVPVSNVTLGTGGQHAIVLNETITEEVACVTSYSRPRANIKWYMHSKSDSTPIYLNDTKCSYDTQYRDLVSTNCTIQLQLNRSYNEWYLVCTAENINNYKPLVTGNIRLNVTYPTNKPIIQCTTKGVYKVVQNKTGTLTCSVNGGNPAGTLHWNCTGGVTAYRGHNNNVTQTVVWNATQTQYCTCTSTNMGGYQLTSVKTEVLYPPVIDELHDKVIFENDSVKLQCDVLRANPTVSVIRWTYNKQTISGATLLIPNISRTNDTVYTCIANNTMDPSCQDIVHGSTSMSLHVVVLYPPSVNIPHVRQITVKEGDMFSYTCPVEHGNPPSTNIMWRRSTDTKTWSSSELLIHNVTMLDDSVYTCYAKSVMVNSDGVKRIGNVSIDIHLNVQFKTNVTDFYIRGYRYSTSVIVMENISLVFECHLQSNPSSDIRIYEAETLVNMSRSFELSYYTYATCSGRPVTYSCHGNNSLSNNKQSSLQLQLSINCTPRRAMQVDERIATSAINETITLSYTALAYPLPSFTWYRNGTATHTDPRIHVSSTDFQTNLTISNVAESDFGEYLLTVANTIGFMNESFYLKPQGVPEVPTHLTQDYTSTTDSTIGIYWSSSFNNGLEQTFTIMYRQQSGYNWQSANVHDRGPTGTTIHYNITRLKSDKSYDIVLFAINAIGRSKYNATLTCRTKHAVLSHSSSSQNVSAIVGGTLTGLVVLCGIAVFVFIYRRRFMRHKQPEISNVQSPTPVTYENLKIEQLPNVSLENRIVTDDKQTIETNVDNAYEGLSRQDNDKENQYSQLGSTSDNDTKSTYENLKIQLSSCHTHSGTATNIKS